MSPVRNEVHFRLLPKLALAGLFCGALPAQAQLLDFETLPNPPGATGDVPFATANGGSRTWQGVTFNASAYADWELIGNQYQAPSSSQPFALSHSGSYVLAGNAYSGLDFFGTVYTGLTLSTSRLLSTLYIGFDNDGGGSNDADTLTITAFGLGGDLAAVTATLSGPALRLLDLSPSFGALSGIVGYRFETTAADALNQAFGRAYVIADDLTFTAAVPEPSGLWMLLAGLSMLAPLGQRRLPARRRVG